MSFWDSSAVIPTLVREAPTEALLELLADDPVPTYWWGLPVECMSGLRRRYRESRIPREVVEAAGRRMDAWLSLCNGVEPSDAVRIRARRLMASHSLRSADALQLAAALLWCEDQPSGESFVCLDARLREAAMREGFTVLPPGT